MGWPLDERCGLCGGSFERDRDGYVESGTAAEVILDPAPSLLVPDGWLTCAPEDFDVGRRALIHADEYDPERMVLA